MKVAIRLVKQKDIKILSKIYAEAYNVLKTKEKWTEKNAREILSYFFKKQSDLSFLAEHKGKIIGAVFTSIKPWWDGNHLADGEIFVHPEYQKQGVGVKLLKNLFKISIKKYDARVLEAFTFKKLKHPLAWYKSIGFKEVKELVMISGDIRKVLKNLKNK